MTILVIIHAYFLHPEELQRANRAASARNSRGLPAGKGRGSMRGRGRQELPQDTRPSKKDRLLEALKKALAEED